MKKGDFMLGILCIVLGMATMIMSGNFPRQASDFPRLISIIMITLGCILVFQYIKHTKSSNNNTEEKMDKSKLIKVLLLACLFIAYYLVIEVLGYIISTFLIVFLTIQLLGYKKIKVKLVLSTTLSIFLYLIFTFLFQVNLPNGLFY